MRLFASTLSIALLVSIGVRAATIVAPSGSTAAVAQPGGTTVFLYPLIRDLEPYIVSAAGAIITALAAIAVAYLGAHYNIKVTAAQQAKLDRLLKTEAGIYIAKGDAAVMNAKIDVGSPGIAAAANAIIAAVPEVVEALGLSQASVQSKIVGEIGKLQAAAT